MSAQPEEKLDARNCFSCVDPATNKRFNIRDMTDQQLKRFIGLIGLQCNEMMKCSIARLQKDPRTDEDIAAAFQLMQQSYEAQGFRLVIEYEQNRRLNSTGLILPPR